MAKQTDVQAKQKQIKDLTLHELDMIYSLARVGNWPDSEIARVYKLPEGDVRKVFDNYVELRGTVERNQHNERLPQDPSPERIEKKPRMRRSDARYATGAERQAAYRARLQERRRAGMQLPSPDPVSDSPAPVEEELSVATVDIP